jgi:predicted secreted hydrolase
MATISYANNKQETAPVDFFPLGHKWTSPTTNIPYFLSWGIKIKDWVIETEPLIKDCEMNHGFISYWEGPVQVLFRGKKSFGFMEFLSKQPERSIVEKLSQLEDSAKQTLSLWNN